MLNEVKLIGRTGKAPEIRTCQNGTKVMQLSIATNDYFEKDGKKTTVTDWHEVTLFNPSQFFIDNICKGTLVYCSGKLKTSMYENKAGQKIYKTYILANMILLLNAKEENQTPMVEKPKGANMIDVEDSDIPF